MGGEESPQATATVCAESSMLFFQNLQQQNVQAVNGRKCCVSQQLTLRSGEVLQVTGETLPQNYRGNSSSDAASDYVDIIRPR